MPSCSLTQSNTCNNDVKDTSSLCIVSLILFILFQVMEEDMCKFHPQEQFGVLCNNGDYVVFQCRLLKPDTNVSISTIRFWREFVFRWAHWHWPIWDTRNVQVCELTMSLNAFWSYLLNLYPSLLCQEIRKDLVCFTGIIKALDSFCTYFMIWEDSVFSWYIFSQMILLGKVVSPYFSVLFCSLSGSFSLTSWGWSGSTLML